jgi:hypothetical protein
MSIRAISVVEGAKLPRKSPQNVGPLGAIGMSEMDVGDKSIGGPVAPERTVWTEDLCRGKVRDSALDEVTRRFGISLARSHGTNLYQHRPLI